MNLSDFKLHFTCKTPLTEVKARKITFKTKVHPKLFSRHLLTLIQNINQAYFTIYFIELYINISLSERSECKDT